MDGGLKDNFEDMLTVETEYLEGGILVIKAFGNLELATESILRTQVNKFLKSERKRIILDFSGVVYVDSSGLGVILGTLRRVLGYGGSMCLVNNVKCVLHTLQTTGVSSLMRVFTTVEEAVKYFGEADPV